MKIINPDKYLLLNDHPDSYKWDPRRERIAWEKSYGVLGSILGKFYAKQIPSRMLITVGVSSSGKSTLIEDNLDRLEDEMGYDIIFDARFPNRISRSAVIWIASGLECSVSAVWVNTPLEECVERNRLRSDRSFPEHKLREAHKNIQPPSSSEGFERILTKECFY